MKLTLEHSHSLPTGVLGLALPDDATAAFAACADGQVYRVDLDTGSAQPFESGHASFASACVVLPRARTVISGGYDGTLLWHDTASRKTWRRVLAHRFWCWQLALSPDGSRLASVTGQYLPGGWKYEPAPESEPSVRLFDARSGDPVAAFTHTPPVLSCAFSPDGRYLAAANMMGEIRVWDLHGPAVESPVAQWTDTQFTSWGSIKTHHYCGGIYGLAFSPDASALVGCGMGPMTDPMAGNGRMTWHRWNWRSGELLDRIPDTQRGSGLMETLAWHPDGSHFLMAGRQAQGTWNVALFAARDGALVHSLDTRKRVTHARFFQGGQRLALAGATGQPGPKRGEWPAWGKLQIYRVET